MRNRFDAFRKAQLESSLKNPAFASAVIVDLGRAIETAMLRGIDLVDIRSPRLLKMVAALHAELVEEMKAWREAQKTPGT